MSNYIINNDTVDVLSENCITILKNLPAKFNQRPIWDDKIAEGFIKEYPDKKFRNSIKYQNSYI